MTVLTHVSSHVGGRVGSVALHRQALLSTVVRCVSDVHAIVRWKPRVGHALGRLTGGRRSSIVVRRYPLSYPHYVRITVGILVALGYHSGTVVLVLLVRMFRRHHSPVS